jgi:hypothetical protein
MKFPLIRCLSVLLAMLAWSQGASAFMVTLDVMAMPAANTVASSVKSSSASQVATANANNTSQLENNNKIAIKAITEAATNTKNIMDQALFFAKYPLEWARMARDYSNIGTGWPGQPGMKADVLNALKEYQAYRETQGTGEGAILPITSVYANEIDRYKNANTPYVQLIVNKSDTASAYAGLFTAYQAQVVEHDERVAVLNTMLSKAELDRDYQMITTLIAAEQNLSATQKTAFEIARDMIKENAVITADMPVIQRMAQFTDTRTGASAGTPIQRILFKK